MAMFNYAPRFSKNKPPLIDIDIKGKEFKLRFSAEESHIFIFYFAFFIGEYIPKNCPEWQLYIKLRQILKFVYADELPPNMGEILSGFVADHNQLYIKHAKKNLTPKFHNLLHYGRIQDQIGLIKFTNCARYESFHKTFKQYAYNSQNRINLLKTLVTKYQMQICTVLNSYDDLSAAPLINTGFKKISSFQELKKNFGSNEVINNIFTVKYIDYNDMRFESLMVICISDNECVSTDEMQFAIIENIIYKDESPFLGIQYLKNLEFDLHYFAFSIEYINKFDLIPVNNLKIFKTSIFHVIGNKNLINWF